MAAEEAEDTHLMVCIRGVLAEVQEDTPRPPTLVVEAEELVELVAILRDLINKILGVMVFLGKVIGVDDLRNLMLEVTEELAYHLL